MAGQYSALPGVRGNGITSRILTIPVTYTIVRSKSEAEAGMRHGAKTPQVPVPVVLFFGEADFIEPRVEHVEPLLALRPADQLADAGSQHVHRGHGLAVIVEPHVERLDLLGIVHDDDRPSDQGLGQVALVLGLKVDAPPHRELELVPLGDRGFERLDGVGVVHSFERRADERFEPLDAILVDVLGEERHVVGSLLERGPEEILEEVFGKVGVVIEIGEGDFGLDHPELGEVARGVRILRGTWARTYTPD